MSELLPVLQTLLADVDAGRPAALCAVVRTRGSTPQAPGAALLVRSDLSTLGTLGGGCVEAEVRRRAFQMLQDGQSGLLDYLLNHDYGWDDGLICGGRMYIAVMPFAAPRPELLSAYRTAFDAARSRRPATIPVVVEHEGDSQLYRVRLEVPPTLLIAGAGHVGAALARLAVGLDFHVVVIDDRADFASSDRFPDGVELIAGDIAGALAKWPIDAGTYVVIVTRGHQHDHQALAAVIGADAGYIGLIGSKRKSRMILKDLAEAGAPAERVAAVRTPIGLPIGAVTVPEIAVSIAAELVQVRRQNAPALVEGPLGPGEAFGLAAPLAEGH